jgi:hypothetical protein
MWTRLAIVLGVLASGGCKDPGCIRNSQCSKHFTCVKSVCTPDRSDAGAVMPDAGSTSSEPLDAGVFDVAGNEP